MSKEITIIDDIALQATSLQEHPVVITNAEAMNKAVEALSQANKYLDALTADKETMTLPLMESLKAIRAKYKPTETLLGDFILSVRKEMSRYQTLLINQKKAEEAKIADRVARGTLKVDTAIKKIENMPVVANKSSTDSGSITFKETPTLMITNMQDIPREYLIPDEKKLLDDLKSGKIISGAKVEIIMVPINRRK